DVVLWCCFCFFFQAEDGIRDFHVTGVQTCALPISQDPNPPRAPEGRRTGLPEKQFSDGACCPAQDSAQPVPRCAAAAKRGQESPPVASESLWCSGRSA